MIPSMCRYALRCLRGIPSWTDCSDCTLGCPEKQQVAQNNTVSYMWVNIYLKRHNKEICEFSCIFEERPPIFVFTPIFQKNTPVIRVLTIFLMYTFQICFVCVYSIEQHSSRCTKKMVNTRITGVFFWKIGVITKIGGRRSSKMHEKSPIIFLWDLWYIVSHM